jgi:predicted acyl esterase
MTDVSTQQTPSRLLEFEVEVRRDLMVPMRDGVRLATDVYLPRASDGSALTDLPTLLTRTPYNKEGV